MEYEDSGRHFLDSLHQLEKFSSLPSLLRVFSMHGRWMLSNAFSASIEMTHVIFLFQSAVVTGYIHSFSNVGPAGIAGINPT